MVEYSYRKYIYNLVQMTSPVMKQMAQADRLLMKTDDIHSIKLLGTS